MDRGVRAGALATVEASEVSARDRHEFASELVVVARRWRQRMDERFKSESISSPQLAALYWLSRSPNGISQTDLAERAGVEPATLVRTIDGLEQQSLAERRQCRHDRRVKLVHLTEAARPLLDRIAAIDDELRAELMAGAPLEEVKAALRLLHRLRGSLDSGAASGARASRKQRRPDFIS